MDGHETEREYLLSYLQEEFRAHADVRIRIPPFMREEEDGVSLKTEAREYFFPTEWVIDRRMGEVRELVQKIKDVLEK
jgi:hypothetical protein